MNEALCQKLDKYSMKIYDTIHAVSTELMPKQRCVEVIDLDMTDVAQVNTGTTPLGLDKV